MQRVDDERAGGDGGVRRRGPGPQSAVHRGHAAAGAGTAGDPAGGGVRDGLSRDDRRRRNGCTRCRWSGRRSTASSAGASTAPATATSPAARPSCSASRTRRSSPATWAAAVRCAPSRTGKSVANSLGMSPQSGLPHNNRVGDFDVFALPALMRATGKTLEQLLDDLANRSGLLGLSGYNDLRDIEAAAAARRRAAPQLALDVFVGVGAALPRRLSAAAGRGRRHRLHRRHRRELGADARGGLRRPGLVRHRPRSRSERRRPRARRRSTRRTAGCRCGSCRPTRSWSSPGRRRRCWKGSNGARRSCSWRRSPAWSWRRRRSRR